MRREMLRPAQSTHAAVNRCIQKMLILATELACLFQRLLPPTNALISSSSSTALSPPPSRTAKSPTAPSSCAKESAKAASTDSSHIARLSSAETRVAFEALFFGGVSDVVLVVRGTESSLRRSGQPGGLILISEGEGDGRVDGGGVVVVIVVHVSVH